MKLVTRLLALASLCVAAALPAAAQTVLNVNTALTTDDPMYAGLERLKSNVEKRTAGKLTIAHGEIPNLKMPPMTMSFKARDPAMLKQWKVGDKIRFRATDAKGELTVDSIEAAK